MDVAFISKDCTPPAGRTVGSGGRIFYMDEPPRGKLLARIALFRQDERIVCVCVADQKFFLHKVADEIREIVAAKCDIPFDHILLAATHTHSVPDLVPPAGIPDEDQLEFSFVAEFADLLVEGISDAKNNFNPLKHWTVAFTETEKWGFCRRPIFKKKNGLEQVGTQGSRGADDFVGLDGEDESLLTVFSAYGDQGILGGVVQYACHPTTMYGSKFYTADYPGAFYERMDEEYPGCFLYANGPNGNIGPSGGGEGACVEMGMGLADVALAAMDTAVGVQSLGLEVLSETLVVQRRKPTLEQLAYARDFLSRESEEGDVADFTREMYGFEYHFHSNSPGISSGLCRQLLTLGKEIENGEVSEEVRLQVVVLGDELAFIAVSAEIFNQFKLAIRKNSPFEHNCVIQLANGWNGYIPPAESYGLGGYECCLSLINRLSVDAHDLILNKTLEMLERLKTGWKES